MKLDIRPYKIEHKDIWEEINNASNSSFLTSLAWINFQKSLNKEIDMYLIYTSIKGNNIPIGIMYIEIYRRKVAKFAYLPYGPVINYKLIEKQNTTTQINQIFNNLKKFFQEYITKKRLTLFRIDPLLDFSYTKNFYNLGYKSSLAPGQAKSVCEINLEQSEDEIKLKMNKTKRYYINKSSKAGLEFIIAKNTNDVKEFSDLMKQTIQRKNFKNFNDHYYIKQFEELNSQRVCDIFLVYYKDKAIAGALINYHNYKAYYTHGCSTSDIYLSKLSSPYFLQWEIIKHLKSKGFKIYNMWGVLPDYVKNSPLKGVSDFKKSFGGEVINYTGALEVYNNPLTYYLQRITDWCFYKKDRY